jgi:8-amino-7-oxononanoate synthase
MDALERLLAATLSELDANQLRRSRRAVRVLDAAHVEVEGRALVNFAGNNYLGLTHHPRVVSAARAAVVTHGSGSAAAPLISGYSDLHAAAERALAAWKGTQDAVLLPSGFQANHAAIGALASAVEASGRGIRFLLDKLAHASLIDAVRAVGLPFRVYPHNGIAKLGRLLAEADKGVIQFVVTESIFSMDGDAADLAALAALKREHPFVLILDEAHGSGVFGPAGAGYAAELGLREAVDVSIVTLSKAIGAIGGAICASRAVCDSVVNFGRAYLFSTSVPASVPAAAMAALEVMRDEPERQERVRALARGLRQRLGLPPVAADAPILPIVLGSEQAALGAARELREQGLLVVAIRPPTVAPGTSRLRVTLSCEHTDDEVERLGGALVRIVDAARPSGPPLNE